MKLKFFSNPFGFIGIKRLIQRRRYPDAVITVGFSPDGSTLASGKLFGIVQLWDVATGKLIHTFIGHRGPVNTVSFSPDSRTLASGSTDGTILLWDMPLVE